MDNKSNQRLEDKVNDSKSPATISDLETLASLQPSSSHSLWQKTIDFGKNYLADTSIGCIYYTLLMTPVELGVCFIDDFFERGIFRFDVEKVVDSRFYAIAVGFATHWFYRKFRHVWATRVWKAGPESSPRRKAGAEYTARFIFQGFFYTVGLLYYANATPVETSIAVPIGLALGIATASHYGKVLERWRKYWGLETTLYK